MQNKVSMVIPCYNKKDYIPAMLDSVISQVWDNIELILINDGSTDGTREVITEYEPKLIARGFEVVIIDQENAGCCAAVYAGLTRMTGEYFCIVDCDDGIESEYVSRMAGWLDEHEEYQWTACSYKHYEFLEGKLEISGIAKRKYPQDTNNLLEKWILRDVITTVWIYMTRVSYIKQCGMIENWCCEHRKTYEPLIGVPLMAGGGELRYFHEGLYRYVFGARDLFKFDRFEHAIKYYDDYLYLYKWAIDRLSVPDEVKRRLLAISRISYELELFSQVDNVPDGDEYLSGLTEQASILIDELFEPSPRIPAGQIMNAGYPFLFTALKNLILCEWEYYSPPIGRVIGYGALGHTAARILPFLKETVWEPTELWDIAGDGDIIKIPDFDSLTCSDTVLVLPIKPEIILSIRQRIEECGATVMYYKDIISLLAQTFYGQLKHARLK